MEKPSNNNLARVIEGSVAPLLGCCAGVACRLDMDVWAEFWLLRKLADSSQHGDVFLPIVSMRNNSWLWIALNARQQKKCETPKRENIAPDAR